MMYLAYALAHASGVAGCVVLVLNGHPWFAAAVLFATTSVSMKRDA